MINIVLFLSYSNYRPHLQRNNLVYCLIHQSNCEITKHEIHDIYILLVYTMHSLGKEDKMAVLFSVFIDAVEC